MALTPDRRAYLRFLRARNREKLIERDRARRDALKRSMIEHLGGECVRCTVTLEQLGGYVCAFDFHHVDPTTKSFNLSANLSRTWDVLKAELDKCVLMCATCHRIHEVTEGTSFRGRPPLDGPPRPARTVPQSNSSRKSRAISGGEADEWTLFPGL